MPGLTALDGVALFWFLLCWCGYTWLADHTRWSRLSLTETMNEYRRLWMLTMLRRDDPRIVDTTIQASLLNGIAFFASTSIIVVGGLFALLGAADRAIQLLQDLPLVVPLTRHAWELKLMLLIVIFVYAFFKFAWSFRLLKYCSILIGAVPTRDEINQHTESFVLRIADILNLEARHFNHGLRAYFFSLAMLAWFLHPWLFIVATTWITVVNYRREFQSRTLRYLNVPVDNLTKK